MRGDTRVVDPIGDMRGEMRSVMRGVMRGAYSRSIILGLLRGSARDSLTISIHQREANAAASLALLALPGCLAELSFSGIVVDAHEATGNPIILALCHELRAHATSYTRLE